MTSEFIGERSSLYKEALKEYPEARLEDIKIMKKYLAPQMKERILEVGAGSGFFSTVISKIIGSKGILIVSDPSSEQLEDVEELKIPNIKTLKAGAESIALPKDSIDAVWSFGALHHVFEKETSFKNFHRALKCGGRIVIGDVFSGSKLAKHFDEQVAKYCISGHEVAFWSREYAESICWLVGLEKPRFFKIDQKWKFKSKKDIGIFLYKIHAMTKTTPDECLKGAERILGIEKKDNLYELDWPMEIILTYKK